MKNGNLYDTIDFQFSFSVEMIEENGEDSFYSEINPNYSVLSVFDGCGGSGSKEYENFGGKTGAYIASRAVCGATKKWFKSLPTESLTEKYKQYIDKALEVAEQYADKETVVIKGTMQKPFPTTVSLALSEQKTKDNLVTYFIWAGDSRGYVLDENGLHQLTIDDIDGEDAMSNLSNDGVLKNVVHLRGAYVLHQRTVTIRKQSVVFCATDGCFGYLSTPMEFEAVLLETLKNSDSPEEWKQKLKKVLGEYACDDYSVSLLSFGFEDFGNMKKTFAKRLRELERNYTKNIRERTHEEKCALWNQYKESYENY